MLDLSEEIEELLIEHASKLPRKISQRSMNLFMSADEIAIRLEAPLAFVEDALEQLDDAGEIVQLAPNRWDMALRGMSYWTKEGVMLCRRTA